MLAFSPCLTCFGAILLGKQANKHTKNITWTGTWRKPGGSSGLCSPRAWLPQSQDMECQPSPAEQHSSDIWSLSKMMAAFLKAKPASKHSEETTQRRHAWSSPRANLLHPKLSLIEVAQGRTRSIHRLCPSLLRGAGCIVKAVSS